ncbi:MAG: hypothetical protein J5I90_19950 [Caldilineales bacterium]|nr:hypothetical protein [Caldilineales bacterium]
MGIFDIPLISNTRRNHALEHATIHILSRMEPNTSMAGRSNSAGFFIYGNLPTEAIGEAVNEAIRRLHSGEDHLAIHPNCGTNMVTTAVLVTLTTMLTTAGKKRHLLERIPTGILGATVAVFIAQILGTNLQQRVTTCADIGDVDVLSVERRQVRSRILHWVQLQYHPL